MNYNEAFELLDIDLNIVNYNDISLEYLKKKFHKMALKNHPDKNGNTTESTDKFQKINEAFCFLKREIKHFKPEDFDTDTEHNIDHNSSLYLDILKGFMKTFFEGKYNEILIKFISDILNAGRKISIKLFDDFDKDTTLSIYTFLSNNRSTLHLSEDMLDNIRDIVIKKYNNVEIYKLNPSINDLLNNNLYKLNKNNEVFLVPLWYSESYFDSSGCEIIVICEPELPDNITLDEDNNIYIDICIEQHELLEKILLDGSIKFNIGEKIFDIVLSKLYMKKEQIYKIKNMGISKITNNIYDISEKNDIIVKVIIK
jgi:DnaJ-class molecular chaperone